MKKPFHLVVLDSCRFTESTKHSEQNCAQRSKALAQIPPTAVGGLFQMLSTKTQRKALESHQRELVDCSSPELDP